MPYISFEPEHVSQHSSSHRNSSVGDDLSDDAFHFLRFVAATYRCFDENSSLYQKIGSPNLAGLLHRSSSSRKLLMEHLPDIKGKDLLSTRFTATTKVPAWLVVRHEPRRAIVVALRSALLTEALHPASHRGDLWLGGELGSANLRMAPPAEAAWTHLRTTVCAAMAAHPGDRLVVVGRGQGAAVAVFFALAVWRDCPNLAPHCLAYAAPPLMTLNLARRAQQYGIVSILHGGGAAEGATDPRRNGGGCRTSGVPLHPPGHVYGICPRPGHREWALTPVETQDKQPNVAGSATRAMLKDPDPEALGRSHSVVEGLTVRW